ncbi:MAG: hypothetical protein IT384_00865 [Deltaproteobacteria bacterium]|nr:hypothetical protein [Deltaproteobacteria bacterium]
MQTIAQRVDLIRELLPSVSSIAELCCGDCEAQARTYAAELSLSRYRGLDLSPAVVERNLERGIDCVQGDALAATVLRQFLDYDLVFFGPPLSTDCDGHRLHAYANVSPSFEDFTTLFLGTLGYRGALVCICPKATTMGDVRSLYAHVKRHRPDVNLRLVHHSHSTITGAGESTERRLKYVELWFGSQLPDLWEARSSIRSSHDVG